ncbi:MAG: N-6 DNA methylase [Candidatus Cloacimonetes bacterium]|nr:N-6 DNA methylase [Candidatus Cloacimonadota bacterium]
MLDITTLENWLWDAACKIRGPVDAPKYKDYILPLIFIKRLSDVFEDELKTLEKKFGSLDTVEELIKLDHTYVRIYIPNEARWKEIAKQTINIGEYITDAVRSITRENATLQGVIDTTDFNAIVSGQRIISDEILKTLINVLNRHRLGINDVEPDILGRAYEYLLRKFAEGSGSSAGEFYTPREVAILMAHIIDPQPGDTIYDPCCGSAGLLIKCNLRFKEKYHNEESLKETHHFGQEILPSTFAMAKMNVFIHDMEAIIKLGDSMNRPAFTDESGNLSKFDLIVANPMWNQDFNQSTYENDAYNRFGYGYPPSSSADWGWIQHMFKSLNKNGRLAVVIDTGSVSRGSGNVGSNRERDIRKSFVENDLVEAVLLMPENLFYNTTAPGIIIIINKEKKCKDKILLINASKLFEKGRPKNLLPDASIEKIVEIYQNWKEEESISKIINKEETVKNDYNLSPSRYVSQNGEDDTIPLDEAVVLVKEAEEDRQQADEKLQEVLEQLGFE